MTIPFRPFILFAAVIALVSWSQAAQTTIRGTVRNAAPGKVYLQSINEREVAVSIDSAALKEGTFEFKRSLTEGSFYQLSVGTQKIPLLIEGGETLAVDVDGKTGQAAVTGSKTMEFYQKIRQWESATNAKGRLLSPQYETAIAQNNTKRQREIKAEFDKARDELAVKVRALVPQMGTSWAALYATNFLDPSSDEDYPLFEQLASRFAKEKPNVRMSQAFVASFSRMQADKQTKDKKLAIGKAAPEIILRNPTDQVVALSSLRGKYVLIDFWASWCGPCREENPNVVKMYNQYKPKGFEIYGVSLDQNKAAWLQAIKADGLTWTHVSDLKYWNSAAAQLYGVTAIPFSVLIDPQGNIIAKNLRGAALERRLAEILK